MDLSGVRMAISSFRQATAKLVKEGDGDPTDETLPVGTLYCDCTTVPKTVWIKKHVGWEKVPKGAKE